MVDAYSRDAMGDGKPLDQDIREQLIHGLRRHPTTLIFLAFDGDQAGRSCRLFHRFLDTFAAKPLINIHDFVVLPTSRGKGIGATVAGGGRNKAKELGCCKLTLEVMEKIIRRFACIRRPVLSGRTARRSGCSNFYVQAAAVTQLTATRN